MAIPAWAENLVPGDWLRVKPEMFGRGGQLGMVLDPGPMDDGVGLDFFTSHQDDEYISQEFYEWDELEPFADWGQPRSPAATQAY